MPFAQDGIVRWSDRAIARHARNDVERKSLSGGLPFRARAFGGMRSTPAFLPSATLGDPPSAYLGCDAGSSASKQHHESRMLATCGLIPRALPLTILL